MLRATITTSPLPSNQHTSKELVLPKDEDQNQQHGENYQGQDMQKQPSLKPILTKRPIGLQPKINTKTDSISTTKTDNHSHSNTKRQMDVIPQNVFGQPRLQASLREPLSPRQNHKSGLDEELRRLITLDPSENATEERDTSPESPSPENSLGSGPLDSSLACSPVSDCLELDHLSVSDLSLTGGWDPGLPLPNPAWGPEWSDMVDGAKADDGQRTGSPLLARKNASEDRASPGRCLLPKRGDNQSMQQSGGSSDLSHRLHYLETLLRHLESNLERERQDKVALLEEVTVLRETNHRLWEESLTASEQLRKLTLLFNVTPGPLPRGEGE